VRNRHRTSLGSIVEGEVPDSAMKFGIVPTAFLIHPVAAVKRPNPMGQSCIHAGTTSIGSLFFAILLLTNLGVEAVAAELVLPRPVKGVLEQYCLSCHDEQTRRGKLDIETIINQSIESRSEDWEHVIRKLRTRQMPPVGKERPSEKIYDEVVAKLASALDGHIEKHPNPGRTETFRRLNRSEYQNVIRDLLALDIDATALLPKDDVSQGFDNVGVANLSPTLLNRYIAAAEKISRLAVGGPRRTPGGDTFRVQPDISQEEHVEGLPLGTRGGTVLPYDFPGDGEYEIQIRLTRDRNEEVEGLHEPHELEVLIDRERVKSFMVAPRADKNYEKIDAHLKVHLPVTAGPHQVGVTFVKNPSSLSETKRQPYQAHFNMHRHPRQTPAVYQVSVNGPYDSTGPGNTPSRRRIFGPDGARAAPFFAKASPADEDARAQSILMPLLHRAYRRPVALRDLEKPMEFYHKARETDGFEAGIEAALSAILVSPEFLFRIEQEPTNAAPGTVYRVSELALASRLSFFLWSSIPDDELLALAERGELHKARVFDQQVRRLLADSRSRNLVHNFAEQWLHLRNLESITPDLRLFTDFDDNLRQAFRTETEMHFETILRGDRSVLELLKSDYTFVNERLAKHYGIANVYGSRFRRVALAPDSERGGLLRQGSVLTVTSYATRTSPVIRGKWVLENLMGSPPPPPLPDVPALKDATVSANLSVRARLAEHRSNAACASCHNLMDPIGFSLENFDAIGRWRTMEDGSPIDASGGLPDGRTFIGMCGLEDALLKRPDVFVNTLTEKLLTFALGRGLESYDEPAVRKIVREAKADDYRFSSIILGIVNSAPFTMRKSL